MSALKPASPITAILTLLCCWLPAMLSAQATALRSPLELVDSEVMDEPVPDAAVASAVKAVANLGMDVVQGRYHVALERMNPKEKERLAQQVGGLKALQEKLEAVPAEMVRQGVRVISCKPEGQPRAFGIEPKPTTVTENGRTVTRMVYSQWLVLVPTVTKCKLLYRAEGKPAEWIEIENLSFQVAVSDRDKEDWTFIDGSGLTVGRLRGLYGTLPADIQLPPVQKRQVQN